jgi:lysophospholipase
MVDLHMPRLLRLPTMAVARAQVRRGEGGAYAWSQRPYGPERASPARMAILSGDRDRFLDEARWVAANPGLAVGGVSWGWLAAADASIRALARADLSRVALPLLMLLATRERLVSNPAARALGGRLADCTVETVPGSGHEILRETDAVRVDALSRIEAFLGKALA